MCRRLRYRLICLYAAMPVIAAAGGDEVHLMPEVRVSAMRRPTAWQSTPLTVYSVGGSDIQGRDLARTTPEALGRIPGVMVQKTAHGQGSPYLRGLTGFRTLTLIDGIRLNNSVFRDGPNQYLNTIDAYSLSSLDVIKGPASMLYGSDAVGGCIQAHPLRPPQPGEEDGEQSIRSLYRLSTAERSHIGRLELKRLLTSEVGVAAGITAKHFGDLQGGDKVGRQPHTGYDEYAGDLRLEYRPAPDRLLVYGHQTVTQDDAWRTHRTIYGATWEGLETGSEQKRVLDQQRRLNYLRFRGDERLGFVEGWEMTLSHHRQEEDQLRIRGDGRRDKQGFDVRTLGFNMQAEGLSPLGMWVTGGEIYRDEVKSYRRDYDAAGKLQSIALQGPVADGANYTLASIFAQHSAVLPHTGMEWTAGIRATHARAEAGQVENPGGAPFELDDSWENISASLRSSMPLDRNEQLFIFAGLAQGFRAPNLSDLTRLSTARSNEIETPVESLDPENYLGAEIGLKAGTPRLTGELALFRTLINDMIIRTPTGRILDGNHEVTKKNAGRGFVHGIEGHLNWEPVDALQARIGWAWMEGEIDTYPTSDPQKEREPISRMLPPGAHLALRWEPPKGRWYAEALCDMAARQDRLATSDKADTTRIPPGGTPGYAVFGLRGGYRLNKYLSASLVLENLTDKDYRIHGSGVNEAGRNLVLALEAKW